MEFQFQRNFEITLGFQTLNYKVYSGFSAILSVQTENLSTKLDEILIDSNQKVCKFEKEIRFEEIMRQSLNSGKMKPYYVWKNFIQKKLLRSGHKVNDVVAELNLNLSEKIGIKDERKVYGMELKPNLILISDINLELQISVQEKFNEHVEINNLLLIANMQEELILLQSKNQSLEHSINQELQLISNYKKDQLEQDNLNIDNQDEIEKQKEKLQQINASLEMQINQNYITLYGFTDSLIQGKYKV